MAKEKFYAIRRGRKTGIFSSWGEAKPLVAGVAGAEYKSFGTLAEAEGYLAQSSAVEIGNGDEIPEPYAFTDGSFNSDTGVYGYGVYLVAEGREYVLTGWGDDPEAAKSRNVAGELQGVMAAVDKAKELGLKELTICYDYSGIRSWVTGDWRAKTPLTAAYQEFMRTAGIMLHFLHAKGHSGIAGNERADALAKEAVDKASHL